MIELYPALSRRKAFTAIPEGVDNFSFADLDKLIRFVIVFIDPQSPVYEETDFDYRKALALEALGYKKSERFYEEVSENTDLFNSVLFTYFKMVNNLLFEQWYTMYMNLHIVNQKMASPDAIADSERRQTSKISKQLYDDLVELQHSLFPDEQTARIMAEKSSEEDLGGYAEQYAQEVVISKP